MSEKTVPLSVCMLKASLRNALHRGQKAEVYVVPCNISEPAVLQAIKHQEKNDKFF